ncbi:hypothetical protein E4T39_05305 [Aureobasidium subglaciale]|nr:hypothetical protein E4T39_05305 [Aureobasidium subglaciale]
MAITDPFTHYAGVQNSLLNNQLQKLPKELYEDIMNRADVFKPVKTNPIELDPSKDPSIAPSDGSSPFLNLPCELRCAIFAYLLPGKDKIIEPSQTPTGAAKGAAVPAVAPPAATGPTPAAAIQPGLPPQAPWTTIPGWTHQAALAAFAPLPAHPTAWLTAPTVTRPATRAAKISRVEQNPELSVGDALVLNRQMSSEILAMLYKQRTFALNIYEGIFDGGVEFLNSGLLRLQYREHFTQVRFKRFESPDDPFGFSRIKQLLIRVYPAKRVVSEHQTSRHDAMHTHFMLRALVNLLKKDDKFNLNCLRIRFVEPQHTSWRPHPWQNIGNLFPRCTSIHGVPNVEVILRALIELREVQTAAWELPPGLYRDKGLKDFVDRIHGIVTAKLGLVAMDDELTSKIEGARDMLDDWIHSVMFATKTSKEVPSSLEDSDFQNVQDVDYVDYCPDEDDYVELPNRRLGEGSDTRDSNPALRDLYEERVTSTEELKDKGKGKREDDADDDEGDSSFFRVPDRCFDRHSRRSSLLSSSGSSGGASLFGMVSLDDDDPRGITNHGISNGTRKNRQLRASLNSTERAKLQPTRQAERQERLERERSERLRRYRARTEVIVIDSGEDDHSSSPFGQITRSAPTPGGYNSPSTTYGFLPDAPVSSSVDQHPSAQDNNTTTRSDIFGSRFPLVQNPAWIRHGRNASGGSASTMQQIGQTPAELPSSYLGAAGQNTRAASQNAGRYLSVIDLTEDGEDFEILDMSI